MAVSKVAQATRLALKVRTGTTAAGEPVYKTRTFKGLKTNGTDADVYAVGQALGGLQQYPVANIIRQDDGDLVDL